MTIEVKTNFSENSFAYLRRTRRDRILFFFSAERRKERRDKRRWNNTIYGARADVHLPLGVADHSANPSLNHPLPVHPLPIPTSTLGLKITNVGRLGRDYDGPFVSRVRASSRLSNLPVSDLVNYVDNPNQDGICILFESKNTSLRIAKKQTSRFKRSRSRSTD